VGVDGTAAGHDAVALGSLLAGPTAAELMLIAVREEPLVVVALPAEQNWATSEQQARIMLAKTRDSMVPDARTTVASDTLVWRGLRRVAHREHRDLLVVGSAHNADDGHVRLGRSAAELMAHLECPLAVAPSGMASREVSCLERIGVGFDGRPESQAALGLAASIASAAGAELLIRRVVDDQAPGMPGAEGIASVPTNVRVEVGMPTDVLSELGNQVDLLVIGSGHSRQPRRVQLGDTGRALLHYAPCPVLIVPRQHD
jgi:nucleotide-binding universal stress UspA family protein